MIYVKSQFLNDFQKHLQDRNMQGLYNLYINRIGEILANNKEDLIIGLQRAGLEVDPTMSNDELIEYIVEGLSSGSRPITELIASLTLTSGQNRFANDDADGGDDPANSGDQQNADALNAQIDAPDNSASAGGDSGGGAAKAASSGGGGTQLSGDNLTKVIASVATGVGSIFNFAKSTADNKKAKKAAKQDLSAATGKYTSAPPSKNSGSGGTPPPKKSRMPLILGIGVVATAAIIAVWYIKFRVPKQGVVTAGAGAGGQGGAGAGGK